jgi:hypothetical protein
MIIITTIIIISRPKFLTTQFYLEREREREREHSAEPDREESFTSGPPTWCTFIPFTIFATTDTAIFLLCARNLEQSVKSLVLILCALLLCSGKNMWELLLKKRDRCCKEEEGCCWMGVEEEEEEKEE